MHVRRWNRRLQSRQRMGSEPTTNGCSSTLTWRGFLVAQPQAQVPDPLADDLPRFLPGGCMTAPAIRVALLVFIGKQRFKSATMQVKCDDIGGGEAILREKSEKEFVDHALAGVTNAAP